MIRQLSLTIQLARPMQSKATMTMNKSELDTFEAVDMCINCGRFRTVNVLHRECEVCTNVRTFLRLHLIASFARVTSRLINAGVR